MGMVPKTEHEMVEMIVNATISRAYAEMRAAVGHGRARRIERDILDLMPAPGEFAGEFKTFQAEVAVAKARQLVEQFFEAAIAG